MGPYQMIDSIFECITCGPAEAFGSSLKSDAGPFNTIQHKFSETKVAHSKGSAAHPTQDMLGLFESIGCSTVWYSVGPFKTIDSSPADVVGSSLNRNVRLFSAMSSIFSDKSWAHLHPYTDQILGPFLLLSSDSQGQNVAHPRYFRQQLLI